MSKYNCWHCNGKGKIEVGYPEGDFVETCLRCGGTGRKRITVFEEEYDELKEKASMYDGLCK